MMMRKKWIRGGRPRLETLYLQLVDPLTARRACQGVNRLVQRPSFVSVEVCLLGGPLPPLPLVPLSLLCLPPLPLVPLSLLCLPRPALGPVVHHSGREGHLGMTYYFAHILLQNILKLKHEGERT